MNLNYDKFFISYHEPDADHNFSLLKKRCPDLVRIDNVKGIANAYLKAAELARTPYFYMIDADNIVYDDFHFDFDPTNWAGVNTFCWQAVNNVNGLTYGFGGMKLYSKDLADPAKRAMPTKAYHFLSENDFPVIKNLKFMPYPVSYTVINSSPFSAWRSAFRECCKLIAFNDYLDLDRKQIEINRTRLDIWLTRGQDELNGEWVLRGARAGMEYGLAHEHNSRELLKINDFSWLNAQFNIRYTPSAGSTRRWALVK